MSTYFFRTNIKSPGGEEQIKLRLDELESKKEIERWHLNSSDAGNILEIETNKLTAEQVKHLVREAGFEAEFTKAPEAR